MRTIALRWLTRVAPLERTLPVALAMLRAETQRDLRRRLVRMLAHRRYEPAYATLIDLVFDKDAIVARAAEEALRRLGPEVEPALRHAESRARPDRRERLRSLLE
ncbi:MAG: hypothetical protein R3B82_23710 [Sandaracinaceae bacterium]